MAGPQAPAAAPPLLLLHQDEDRTPYIGGGTVGKLRSGRFIFVANTRRTLPYDRPSSGRHASAGPQAAAQLSKGVSAADSRVQSFERGKPEGWLGAGLVGSASRALANGASFLFSSLFGRRSVAMIENEPDAEGMHPDKADASVSRVKIDALDSGRELYNEREANTEKQQGLKEPDVKDVENLLKQRIFSREQCNRFMELLENKVIDKSIGSEQPEGQTMKVSRISQDDFEAATVACTDMQKGIKVSRTSAEHILWTAANTDMQKGIEEKSGNPEEDNGSKMDTFKGYSLLTNGDHEDLSPVDIAKEYMDKRLFSTSGSNLPFQRPVNKEGMTAELGSFSHGASNILNIGWSTNEKKVQSSVSGRASPLVPVSLGSLYVRATCNQGTRKNLLAGVKKDASSHWIPHHTSVAGDHEIFKRRSSLFEHGMASTGLARRTRHKTFSEVNRDDKFTRQGFCSVGPPLAMLSSSAKVSSMVSSDGPTEEGRTLVAAHANEDESRKRTSASSFVPVKSSETARKILETLERMTSPAKEMPLDEEIAHTRSMVPFEAPSLIQSEDDQISMQCIDFHPLCVSHSSPLTLLSGNKAVLDKPLEVPVKNISLPEKGKGKLKAASNLSLSLPKLSTSFSWSASCWGASNSMVEGIDAELRGLVDCKKVEQIERIPRIAFPDSCGSKDWSSSIKQDTHVVAPQASNSFPLSTILGASTASSNESSSHSKVSISISPLKAGISGSLATAMTHVEHASFGSSSGFTFPLPLQSCAYLESLPTPKPMPSPLSQASPVKTLLPPPAFFQPSMAATTKGSNHSPIPVFCGEQISAELSSFSRSSMSLDMLYRERLAILGERGAEGLAESCFLGNVEST